MLVRVAGVARPTLVREPVAEAKVSGGSKEADSVGCVVDSPALSALPLAPCEATGAGLVLSLVVSCVVAKPHCFDRSGNNGGNGDGLSGFRLLDRCFARRGNG